VAVKDPGSRRLHGVAKAAQLAQALRTELVLFHALSAPLYVDGIDGDVSRLYDSPQDLERRAREASAARLESIARRLRRTGLRVSVSVEWDYPVYEAIVREACRINAGLIVAEQHPGRHFAAGLLHLTDWELLRLSPMPVLLVKRPRIYRRPVVLAAVDPDHSYAKPLRLDQQVLHLAAVITHALRGTLHAAYAYVPVPLTAFSAGALSDEEVLRQETRSARLAASKLQHAARAVGIPRSRRHTLATHPAAAIVQAATRTRSALVVMGAIARSGIKRLLIGNTAERVLDRLACDVLIAKPAGLIKRPPRRRRGARYLSIQPRLY